MTDKRRITHPAPHGVPDAAVDHMRLANASAQTLQTSFHLGNHALINNAALDQVTRGGRGLAGPPRFVGLERDRDHHLRQHDALSEGQQGEELSLGV